MRYVTYDNLISKGEQLSTLSFIRYHTLLFYKGIKIKMQTRENQRDYSTEILECM